MENINERISEVKRLIDLRNEELKLAEKARVTDSTIVWRRELINSIRDLKEELVSLETKLEEIKIAEEARKRDASKTAYFHDQKSDEYFGLDPEEVRKEEERMKKEAEERRREEEAKETEKGKLTPEEIKEIILDIERRQREIGDGALRDGNNKAERESIEEELVKLEKKQFDKADDVAKTAFLCDKRINKFISRYKEHRKNNGIIKSFFNSLRKDEEVDARICEEMRNKTLEEHKKENDGEKNELKTRIHREYTMKFIDMSEKFANISIYERQKIMENTVMYKFPKYKDEILSISEEMKKYEKEISEYYKTKDEKVSERVTEKDAKKEYETLEL